MEKISLEQEFYDAIAETRLTAAVFKTTWCKDCHFLEAFMPQILEKYDRQIHFIEVDRDEFIDLCDKYNVLGIPSFILFAQGREVVRFVSKLRKTKEEVEQFLDRAIEIHQTLTR